MGRAMMLWFAGITVVVALSLAWNVYWASEIRVAECNRALRVIERAGCYVVDDEGYRVAIFGE